MKREHILAHPFRLISWVNLTSLLLVWTVVVAMATPFLCYGHTDPGNKKPASMGGCFVSDRYGRDYLIA
jgi:hypothetical protein